MSRSPLKITVEGEERSGKTTLVLIIKKCLEDHGISDIKLTYKDSPLSRSMHQLLEECSIDEIQLEQRLVTINEVDY